MEIRWGMSQQEGNCLMNDRIAHIVIVLQKEVDLFVDLRQAVNQRRYDRRRADQRGFEDQIDCGTTHAVMGALQRVGYVKQKLRWLIVISVDRKPRNQIAALRKALDPFGGQRGLAE